MFAVFLLSYTIYEAQGWYNKMKDLMKSRKNSNNIATISGAIPMNDLSHLQKPTQLRENSHPEPSTSKCAVSTPTTLKSINAVLPGQIPLDETPETIEPMDPKPSTSTNATKPSHSSDISPEINPQHSTSSESLSTVRMRSQKATPTSTSALPSTNFSTKTTPSGI